MTRSRKDRGRHAAPRTALTLPWPWLRAVAVAVIPLAAIAPDAGSSATALVQGPGAVSTSLSAAPAERNSVSVSRSAARPQLFEQEPTKTLVSVAEPITLQTGEDGTLRAAALPSWIEEIELTLSGDTLDLAQCTPPDAENCTSLPVDEDEDGTGTTTVGAGSMVGASFGVGALSGTAVRSPSLPLHDARASAATRISGRIR